ncbi:MULTISPECIES: cupin domain-containing protein [Bifidobacterium]|jgi:predicted cupin superfamily sugar epimerase|uniref:Cupin domain-containing protein n=1 Tax=Bifidobacterium tibiigranuli TaxID=2172043 RepID=A0A5N6S1H3_9BIFI|nr:cupin domain-containing protein [Bifidobacterium tibiigranuli]KAE8127510.1 cupin domain-containing protein [Bifidobacterium tibiigranuli]KAE8127957.1 cupin domain-containing protein [Bifidobacterium tibiigranuli]MCH3975101.1 cupin domain-containing protein [Bifidobacterium tibiigranuli]MCH4190472.1 cupin domain-containing protein [Bifidobacterium tibiigranuli]MCH4202859.1 cupin domain-containing protein [Bifidobacterium tibiigranuli]
MNIALHDMSPFARDVALRLGLEAHPEGGWYTRDWQSEHLDADSRRPLASLIYFLLPQGDASAWHKVDADEIWLWHGPANVTLELGGFGDKPETNESRRERIILGSGLSAAQVVTPENGENSSIDETGKLGKTDSAMPIGHAIVPADCWQRTIPGVGDALVSCLVSPGFTFDGFTLE